MKLFRSVMMVLPLVALFQAVPATAADDQSDLQLHVITALNRYYMTPFEVSAYQDGKVEIRGTVETYYDKLDVYEIAASVPGVKEIVDQVKVHTETVPDDIIKANILDAIQDNSVILEPEKISVDVTDGLVLLSGKVSYFKEKIMAMTVASHEDGVLGVQNAITVLSRVEEKSDENIASIVKDIIVYQFPMIKDQISFTVTNGQVSLQGKSNTLWEKTHLRDECSKVLGVKGVQDYVAVK